MSGENSHNRYSRDIYRSIEERHFGIVWGRKTTPPAALYLGKYGAARG